MRVLGVLIRNSIVHADPFVSMVVGSHAIIKHCPSLLNQIGQKATCSLVLGVDLHMTHLQDDFFTHDSALNGCIATVKNMSLVLFDGLIYPVLKNLLGSSIFKAKGPLDHLIGVGQISRSEPISIAI